MKSKRIRIWIISAVLYLALVIIVYGAYTTWIVEPEIANGSHEDQHGKTTENTHDDHDKDDDHGQGHGAAESEVVSTLTYYGSLLQIAVNDKEGNPVTEFEINHEKLMHLIVVSHDLSDYYHFHPTSLDNGEFELEIDLPEGSYKAFTDIKPVGYSYLAEPIPLKVGNEGDHGHANLVPETNFTKTIENVTVTMDPTTFVVGAPITLHFMIDGAKPEPYLGALGHVVILDESATNYVHVHPLSDKETKFETQFEEPGLYKIWGEFQFNGVVYVYPFVIEVK